MKYKFIPLVAALAATSPASAETLTAFKLADDCYANDGEHMIECASYLVGVWSTASVYQEAANPKAAHSGTSPYMFCDNGRPPTASALRDVFNDFALKGHVKSDEPAPIAAIAAFAAAYPCK